MSTEHKKPGKITLCGSIAFYAEMERVAAELQKRGFEVKLPPTTVKDGSGADIPVAEYYAIRKAKDATGDWIWKRKAEAMRAHFAKIEWADVILVVNPEKNGVPGYIGANTLLEMGLAFHLEKPIYLLHELPKLSYTEEILGMNPTLLDSDLRRLPMGETVASAA